MKPPPFTVQVLMLAVVVGLAVWGYHRSAAFASKADEYAIKMGRRLPVFVIPVEEADSPACEVEYEAWKRLVDYEKRMYNKYLFAAHFPWLPVGTDPTPPSEAAGPREVIRERQMRYVEELFKQ